MTTEAEIDFPHAAQVFRVLRYTGGLDGQRRTKEVAHYRHQPHTGYRDWSRPWRLLREHWGAIETSSIDTTFREDASTLRAGTAAQAMAIIRNTLIATFRLAG